VERRKFTRELKLEAVRLIKDRGVSYGQALAGAGRAYVAVARLGEKVRRTIRNMPFLATAR
jgi:transposase-like protein